MYHLLLTILVFNLLCIVGNLTLLLLPFYPRELAFWQRLGMGSLRKHITRHRKVIQPLSANTYDIARKNIIWHIVLTMVLVIVCLRAIQSHTSMNTLLAILSPMPSVAWCIGSIIQRQKMAILAKKKTKF